MRDEQTLFALFETETPPRRVEPDIFSVYATDDAGNAYDRPGALSFYDQVACNRFYNRLVWGYWPSAVERLCRGALDAASGWVLDAGCGSLAFTAKAYAACRDRPVICLDQSLTLLRLAKRRLVRLAGRMPDNIALVHADALALPFGPHRFATVVACNLLHAVPDAARLVRELTRVAEPGGNMACTTLIRAGRLADRYLEMWGRAGEVVPRSRREVLDLFKVEGSEASLAARQKGNMLFLESAARTS
ncbi:Methyltransferase type 11 [Solidesulfovibrio fructosivorans JJ]]|uniref:Methyltransferase type 11 n=1 Tax=Solidesulfovibrio fructosivorans JJ] TaxID=596151 RepID=E1JVY0_SOLFR|nr:class I SAM-dependent methyltransferase [Solidesulfovibrio fructosivorans]EFL51618.1 Methyltransferase type 11 [Solidesulfovibrio fructosivorans JJ]]